MPEWAAIKTFFSNKKRPCMHPKKSPVKKPKTKYSKIQVKRPQRKSVA